MDDDVIGVRFAWNGPLVFCRTLIDAPRYGQRVVVALDGETREGIVALAPELIVAAPSMDDAPRVVDVLPGDADDADDADDAGPDNIPSDVVFLPSDDASIAPADLARALRLSALSLPPPPPERR